MRRATQTRTNGGRPGAPSRATGLTPAEQRVAQLLAQGVAVTAIAERLGLSVHTVRHHLQSIYGKTGTHRQVELVRLLLGKGLSNG